MNRTFVALIAFIGILALVACTAKSAPATEVATENPAAMLPSPSLAPTVEPTATLEPTAAPTQAPSTLQQELSSWEPQRTDKLCEPSDTRTCAVLYVLANQYDDEHVLMTRPDFEKAGYEIFVAANTLKEIRGFHACYDFTPAYPDILLDEVDVADYDAILFAEGASTELHRDPAAHRIAQDAMGQGKVVAAVGDGPVILAKAGVLEGRRVAVLRNMQGIGDEWVQAVEIHGAIYSGHSFGALARDGLLITTDIATVKLAWGIIEVMEGQFQ